MNDLDRLAQFLRTDPRDAGCDEAMAVLHVYVDLVAAGGDAAGRYPGVVAHLAACRTGVMRGCPIRVSATPAPDRSRQRLIRVPIWLPRKRS